ncbi:MAG: HAD-IC family P-type ATPase, partial [Spirochaetales bacterium]
MMRKIFKKWEDSLTYPPIVFISGLCILVSLIGEYVMPFFGDGTKNVILVNFAWVSIVLSGIPMLITAIKRILVGWISSPLLISAAMIAAIYVGDIFAAGEVVFIMAIGAWLEDKTVEKTKKGLKTLLNLVPSMGRRITILADGSVKEEEVKAEHFMLGDVIRILPGESFAADGKIIVGETSVDQSIMTGESLPVDKLVGDEVFSGTINRFGSVDVQITKAFKDSSLQKMINLVNDAEKNKAPTELLADKWARWLVPVALLIAIGAYVFTCGAYGHDEALVRGVTVLVVFCPCALVLATPTSVVAAIGQATKYGVLIKSGAALENMGKIDTVAF